MNASCNVQLKNRTAAGGFTIIELLVTMSIVAVLMAIGVPSFRYVTNSNRIASEINGLLGDLQFARSEAIKDGRTVTVCVSANGTSCSNATSWHSGWIVFSDPTNVGTVDTGEVVLRVQAPFSGTDTFNASNNVKAVTFNREGYAVGIASGTLITLQDATATSGWTRCLSVNLVGQIITQKQGTTVNGVTCT